MGRYVNGFQRRVGRRRVLATALAGSGVIAASAIGCGDDEAQPAASPQSEGGRPRRGGKLTLMATAGEAPHMDPMLTATTGLMSFGPGIAYSRLVQLKLSPDIEALDSIPEGDLAASWEQADDSTFIFKLRPGVKWHNIAPVNGRVLTAEDVAYSFTRQRDLKINAGIISSLKSWRAVDATTLRVELDKPDADFPLPLTSYVNKVVAREAVELRGDLKEGPVIGSGAWIFKEWTPQVTLKMVRNPDYYKKDQFGTQLPYLDELEYLRAVGATDLALAAFRTQQIGAIVGPGSSTFDNETVAQLKKQSPEVEVLLDRLGGSPVVLKTTTPPMNDLRVRQAVMKALDRQEMLNVLEDRQGGFGSASLMKVLSRDQLLPEAEVKQALQYDPAGARQLLQQAGVTNWRPVIAHRELAAVARAELVLAQLKKVGIEGRLEQVNNVQTVNYYTRHDREFALLGRAATVIGPNQDLTLGYKTGAPLNVAELSDPELDRLIDAQGAELKDPKRRTSLLQQIQRRILALASPQPLYDPDSVTMIRWPWARDFFGRSKTEGAIWELVWLDR